MIENSKSPSNCCKFCGWEFHQDVIERILENNESVLCEFCGIELNISNVNTKEGFNKAENGKIGNPDKEIGSKKRAIFKNFKKWIQPQKYSVSVIFGDDEFPKIFKENLIIVVSRLIFVAIRKWEEENNISIHRVSLEKPIQIYIIQKIKPILDKRVPSNFLNNLFKINKEDFEEWLRVLQKKIESDQDYKTHFKIYLTWLIQNVFKLVSDMWDMKNLPKFQITILKDLKHYSFPLPFNNRNTNAIKIGEVGIPFEEGLLLKKSSNLSNSSKTRPFINNDKNILTLEKIDILMKSIQNKDLPSRNRIKEKKLIANKKKYSLLKKIVIEQIKIYKTTQNKLYRINEIRGKIGYESNTTRIMNTIKYLIGEQLYPIFFGGEYGQKSKYKLTDLYHLAETIGTERYGTPGIVTPKGLQLFLNDIRAGFPSSKARTEIWCRQEGHPPFSPVIYKLVHERSWCRQCNADERMKSYDEVLNIGVENGWFLDETIETFAIKMRNRGNINPKDVKLYWKCAQCGNPKNYSYNNIKKKTEGETSGCKICFSRSLEITKPHVEEIARKKGINLDMTDEEFEAAKDKIRKQHRPPTQAKLIWKIRGQQVPLTFNYVAYLMKNRARYKFRNYISPTGHRSSEGENHGRWVLQKMFGVRFDHTFLREIVGDELNLSGKTIKIHPRSHVDGYNVVQVKKKEFKLVYEFWEMYHHKYLDSKRKDKFKQKIFKKKDIVSIILTDEQDPVHFQQIIATQFKKQTGIKIQHKYQENLDTFIEG